MNRKKSEKDDCEKNQIIQQFSNFVWSLLKYNKYNEQCKGEILVLYGIYT